VRNSTIDTDDHGRLHFGRRHDSFEETSFGGRF
jgi:hypothetical protein